MISFRAVLISCLPRPGSLSLEGEVREEEGHEHLAPVRPRRRVEPGALFFPSFSVQGTTVFLGRGASGSERERR